MRQNNALINMETKRKYKKGSNLIFQTGKNFGSTNGVIDLKVSPPIGSPERNINYTKQKQSGGDCYTVVLSYFHVFNKMHTFRSFFIEMIISS